jgi:hypothetical protein
VASGSSPLSPRCGAFGRTGDRGAARPRAASARTQPHAERASYAHVVRPVTDATASVSRQEPCADHRPTAPGHTLPCRGVDPLPSSLPTRRSPDGVERTRRGALVEPGRRPTGAAQERARHAEGGSPEPSSRYSPTAARSRALFVPRQRRRFGRGTGVTVERTVQGPSSSATDIGCSALGSTRVTRARVRWAKTPRIQDARHGDRVALRWKRFASPS